MGVVATAERLVKRSRSAAARWRRRASTVGAARRRRWNVGRAPGSRTRAPGGQDLPAAARRHNRPRRSRARSATARSSTSRSLPAGHGDCLWIEYGDDTATHRMADRLRHAGDVEGAARARRRRCPRTSGCSSCSCSRTSIRITSAARCRSSRRCKRGLRFGDVWFNGWRHISGQLGARQGEMFSTAIQDFELPWNVWRAGGTIVVERRRAADARAARRDEADAAVADGAQNSTKLKPVWTRELKTLRARAGRLAWTTAGS